MPLAIAIALAVLCGIVLVAGAVPFALQRIRRMLTGKGFLPTRLEMSRHECVCGFHLDEESSGACPNCGRDISDLI